jgi:hypothetical protein
MENISNQLLYEFKVNLLKQIFPNVESYHQIHCQYHGLNLKFFSTDTEFFKSLKQFLPSCWLQDITHEYEIILIDPMKNGMSELAWSAESSQDCYHLNNNSAVVQRDFAAKIIGNKVILFCRLEIGDGFFNFLRWFISERLMEKNKFVLHASCVLNKNGNAFIFLGHSGAGKTTLTSLSGPRDILGDDMNIISFDGNELKVEAGAIGGQFMSSIGYSTKRKVEKIFWLKQSKENKSITVSPMSGAQRLLASFANLNWEALEDNKKNKILDFSHKVTQSIKIEELCFQKNKSIWDVIDP